MFRRWRSNTPAPLTGAPVVRRQKTYSAESGYVYQYYFQGKRETSQEPDSSVEFVFEVSADRKTSFPVSVFVPESALAPWKERHDMGLSSTERYAVAKLALFEAFDQRETPTLMREHVVVSPRQASAILDQLGIG